MVVVVADADAESEEFEEEVVSGSTNGGSGGGGGNTCAWPLLPVDEDELFVLAAVFGLDPIVLPIVAGAF